MHNKSRQGTGDFKWNSYGANDLMEGDVELLRLYLKDVEANKEKIQKLADNSPFYSVRFFALSFVMDKEQLSKKWDEFRAEFNSIMYDEEKKRQGNYNQTDSEYLSRQKKYLDLSCLEHFHFYYSEKRPRLPSIYPPKSELDEKSQALWDLSLEETVKRLREFSNNLEGNKSQIQEIADYSKWYSARFLAWSFIIHDQKKLSEIIEQYTGELKTNISRKFLLELPADLEETDRWALKHQKEHLENASLETLAFYFELPLIRFGQARRFDLWHQCIAEEKIGVERTDDKEKLKEISETNRYYYVRYLALKKLGYEKPDLKEIGQDWLVLLQGEIAKAKPVMNGPYLEFPREVLEQDYWLLYNQVHPISSLFKNSPYYYHRLNREHFRIGSAKGTAHPSIGNVTGWAGRGI